MDDSGVVCIYSGVQQRGEGVDHAAQGELCHPSREGVAGSLLLLRGVGGRVQRAAAEHDP